MMLRYNHSRELKRWIIAGVFALVAIFVFQIITFLISGVSTAYESEVTKNVALSRGQLESRIKAYMPSPTFEQRDELISFERQRIMAEQEYHARDMRNLYYAIAIGLLLLVVSVFISKPIVRLTLAFAGFLYPSMQLWEFDQSSAESLQLVLFFLLLFAGCVLLWNHFCVKQANPDRYKAVQVVAVGAITYAVFFFTQIIISFLPRVYRMDPIRVEHGISQKRIEREKEEILKKDGLSEAEKEQYLDLTKKMYANDEKYINDLASSQISSMADVLEITAAARAYRAVAYIAIAALCIFLGIVVQTPLYLSFGFIFAAIMLLLRLAVITKFYY